MPAGRATLPALPTEIVINAELRRRIPSRSVSPGRVDRFDRPPRRVLHVRTAVRTVAALGGGGRRADPLSRARGAGSGPDRGRGTGAVRQGAGHRAGSFGARLLADRRGQRGCRRRCVERHAGADRRSRRRRARLPARAHRGAALQAAGVRAGRDSSAPTATATRRPAWSPRW